MKNSYLYTVLFMLLLSVVLSAALGFTNHYYKPVIEANETRADKKAILDALALDTSGTSADIEDRFSRYVSLIESDDRRIYARLDDTGAVDGYAVPFTGAGLWGAIQGYLAVSKDLKTTLGVVFTDQNETPGLGGRIDETAFRDQFRGLDIGTGAALAYGSAGGGKIDAIAGATSTSVAVLTILNRLIEQDLPGLEVLP
jgi:Na+-transporting NADH:ubiquinone oxidoreductase subunit C